jgi:uncharacterized protein YgbK (DUF1537 family)
VKVHRQALFNSLPEVWPEALLPEIQARVGVDRRKLVVLDDDPTGTQTVHDIPVLTTWSVAALEAELLQDAPAFYLLTNSRSYGPDTAQSINDEIGRNLSAAARNVGREFAVVSRSDSTLRGHFPAEVDALAAGLAREFDAWILVPCFFEGGRYTVDNVHYVAEDDWLIPAAETPFARDAAFGYHSSELRQWVAEKTGGRIPAAAVASLTIDELRRGGPAQVADRLLALPVGAVCVVNAAAERDLEVLVRALLAAEAQGKRFLYRTAASFVPIRAGLAPRPLLQADELLLPQGGGGLIMVGSYVPKTTAQVQTLLQESAVVGIELRVDRLLDEDRCEHEVARVAGEIERALAQDADVVVYTSRNLVTGPDGESSLAIGRRISNGLVSIVQALTVRPRYLLAKGGITSSDLATAGLNVERALVLGQILPGVPVWQLGPESRFPGMPYIVFPGNVGGPTALVDVVSTLRLS